MPPAGIDAAAAVQALSTIWHQTVQIRLRRPCSFHKDQPHLRISIRTVHFLCRPRVQSVGGIEAGGPFRLYRSKSGEQDERHCTGGGARTHTIFYGWHARARARPQLRPRSAGSRPDVTDETADPRGKVGSDSGPVPFGSGSGSVRSVPVPPPVPVRFGSPPFRFRFRYPVPVGRSVARSLVRSFARSLVGEYKVSW